MTFVYHLVETLKGDKARAEYRKMRDGSARAWLYYYQLERGYDRMFVNKVEHKPWGDKDVLLAEKLLGGYAYYVFGRTLSSTPEIRVVSARVC